MGRGGMGDHFFINISCLKEDNIKAKKIIQSIAYRTSDIISIYNLES